MEEATRAFELPPLEERHWFKVIDTALPSPLDIVEPEQAMLVPGTLCHVEGHSVVVLISRVLQT
jgi:glycogen operon protein